MTYELQAELRNETGSRVANRMRRQGYLPAVVYGKGHENKCLKVSEKEVDKILRSKSGKNTFIKLKVNGDDEASVLIKDYQGHAITRAVTHVDFMVVTEDQNVEVSVPVRFEGRAAGLIMGGVQEVVSRKVNLICEAAKIPDEIVVDVTNLNLGENIHLSDIQLPAGVTCRPRYNPALVTMSGARKAAEEAQAQQAAAAEAKAAPAAEETTEKK